MQIRKKLALPGREVDFTANLISSILAGLIAGGSIGWILGLKIARINPSMTVFDDVWALATHFLAIYAVAGMAAAFIAGIIVFPFLKKSGLKHSSSLFNFYIPAYLVIGLLYYIRAYLLTHFIINPLLPLKGAPLISWGVTLVFAGIAYFVIKFFLRITKNWNFRILSLIFGGLFIVIWSTAGIMAKPVQYAGSPDYEEFKVTPNGQKVALIGIDGAWWEIIDPLMQAGELPNFQKLVDNGARADLNTLYPTFSAMIWTSVATGKLPQKHGINSFLVWTFPVTGAHFPIFRLPKLAPELLWIQENIATVAPIPSNYRTASSLWNIFSDNDVSVGVMNWWASWPAEEVDGYLYTDHALFNKLDILTNYKEKSGGSEHDIYPPELILELQGFAYTPEDFTYEDLAKFVNVESDAFWDEFRELDTYEYIDIAYEASMFKFSFPGDKTVIDAANYLLSSKNQPDFWAIYLQGMDSMSHQYLKYHFPENYDKLNPVNIQRYKDLIKNYYKYMDETLGRFLEKLDPKTLVFVVSDHGFDNQMLPSGHYHHIRPSVPGESEEFHLTDSHPGVFIASGPGIKKGCTTDNVSILDLTPTILAAMGFPYAEDMDGNITAEIFESAPVSEYLATYDKPRELDRTIIETPVDKEVRDKLKALGYVK